MSHIYQRKIIQQKYQHSTNIQKLTFSDHKIKQHKPFYYINIIQKYPFSKIQSQTYFQIKLNKCIFGKRQQIQHKLFNDQSFALVKKEEDNVQNQKNRNNLNLVTTFLINQQKNRSNINYNNSKIKIQNLDKIIQAFQKIRSNHIIKFNVQSEDKSKSDRQSISIILNYQVVKKSIKKYIMDLPSQKHVQTFLKKVFSDIKQLYIQFIINEIQFCIPNIDNIGVQILFDTHLNSTNKEKLQHYLSQKTRESNPQLYPYSNIKVYIDLYTCKYLKCAQQKYLTLLSNIDENIKNQYSSKFALLLAQYKQKFPERCQFNNMKQKPIQNQSALLQALEQRRSKNQILNKQKLYNTSGKYYKFNAIMEQKQDQQELSLQNYKKTNQQSPKKNQLKIKQKNKQNQQKNQQKRLQSISSVQNAQYNKKSSPIQLIQIVLPKSINNERPFMLIKRQSQPLSIHHKKLFFENDFNIIKRNSLMNSPCYDQVNQKQNYSTDLMNDSNFSVLSNRSIQIKNKVNSLLQKSIKTLNSFRQKYIISKEKSYLKEVLKTDYHTKEQKRSNIKQLRDKILISGKQIIKKQYIYRYQKA